MYRRSLGGWSIVSRASTWWQSTDKKTRARKKNQPEFIAEYRRFRKLLKKVIKAPPMPKSRNLVNPDR